MTAGKPPLVLLHGWASHPQVFRGLARALEKKCRVEVLPLPGYAGNSACMPYTLDNLVDALTRAAPKSCGVIGWSLGAQVALAWARRCPQQVERLALIAATPCFAQCTGGVQPWPHAVPVATLRRFTSEMQRDSMALLRRFVALQSQGDVQAVRVAHKLRTALFTNALPSWEALEGGLEILRTADLRDTLSHIAQPALVLHGECDAVTPCAAGAALSRMLPRARFHSIAGAGHAPFLSRSDAVVQTLREFFDEAAIDA